MITTYHALLIPLLGVCSGLMVFKTLDDVLCMIEKKVGKQPEEGKSHEGLVRRFSIHLLITILLLTSLYAVRTSALNNHYKKVEDRYNSMLKGCESSYIIEKDVNFFFFPYVGLTVDSTELSSEERYNIKNFVYALGDADVSVIRKEKQEVKHIVDYNGDVVDTQVGTEPSKSGLNPLPEDFDMFKTFITNTEEKEIRTILKGKLGALSFYLAKSNYVGKFDEYSELILSLTEETQRDLSQRVLFKVAIPDSSPKIFCWNTKYKTFIETKE